MMTLVSSARRHDLDVRVYLKDVLDQLLAGCTDYHRLLPDVLEAKPSGSGPPVPRGRASRQGRAQATRSRPAPSGRPPRSLRPRPPPGPTWDW